jgi:hypothetical protein
MPVKLRPSINLTSADRVTPGQCFGYTPEYPRMVKVISFGAGTRA